MAGIRDIKKPSRAMARHLEKMGRKGDTILAHINPKEAALLKRLGGAGTRNPKTGLLEFNEGGGDNSADANNSDPGDSSFGSSVDFGGTGFDGGGFASNPNNGGGNDPSYGAGTTGMPPAATQKTPEQLAAEAAERAAHQARLARSYANPMAHIAGGGVGYQGNLDSYRPNYYAYGPSPTMQFGADFQAPQSAGGLENALGRIYSGATGQAPTQQSAQNWEGQLRAGMSPGDFRRLLVSSPAGWDEGQYLAANPDVAAAVQRGEFGTGFDHYNQYGRSEGRFAGGGLATLSNAQRYPARFSR